MDYIRGIEWKAHRVQNYQSIEDAKQKDLCMRQAATESIAEHSARKRQMYESLIAKESKLFKGQCEIFKKQFPDKSLSDYVDWWCQEVLGRTCLNNDMYEKPALKCLVESKFDFKKTIAMGKRKYKINF